MCRSSCSVQAAFAAAAEGLPHLGALALLAGALVLALVLAPLGAAARPSDCAHMNPLLLWFHRTGSPPNFERFAARWVPWCFAIALLLMLPGIYGALFVVPADYKQGDSFRILYIHVPAAWSAMFIFVAMAIQAFIALVWRIKACETLAVSCAPVGAAFAAITLITGSIWGRPTWGTWWEWDARLTSMLVMFFLYLGVIALHNAIEDRRTAARAACFLALIGVINVPISSLLSALVEQPASGRDHQPDQRRIADACTRCCGRSS